MNPETIIRLAKSDSPELAEYATKWKPKAATPADAQKIPDPVTCVIKREKFKLGMILIGLATILIWFVQFIFEVPATLNVLVSVLCWGVSAVVLIIKIDANSTENANAIAFERAMTKAEKIASCKFPGSNEIPASNQLERIEEYVIQNHWERNEMFKNLLLFLVSQAQLVKNAQGFPWKKKEAETLRQQFVELRALLLQLMPELPEDDGPYFNPKNAS